MIAAAHTQGPWSAIKATNDIAIFPAGAKASAGSLARVRIPCGMESTAWMNARLISAAPQLAAALKRLIEDAAGPHDPEDWTPSRPYQVAIDAYIKATGLHPLTGQAAA